MEFSQAFEFLVDLHRCCWEDEIFYCHNVFLLRNDPTPKFIRADTIRIVLREQIQDSSLEDIGISPVVPEIIFLVC